MGAQTHTNPSRLYTNRHTFAILPRLCYIFAAMKTSEPIRIDKRDALISVIIGIATFTLYARTLAPSVAFIFDDTLDFQYSIPRLGIPHQTGYPLFAILGKLFTTLVPLNDPAYRLNLFTALNAAIAVAFIYLVARRLVTNRIAAIVAALTFAVGQTFWENAVIAEVYATQILLAVLILFFALHYAARPTRHSLYALAFVMGLGLAHHRLLLLIYPAIALYVLLNDRSILKNWAILARALFFLLLPFTFYLYLPLRGAVGSADGTYQNTLPGFFEWVMASQYSVFLTQNPLHIERDAAFYVTLFQQQFTTAGLALAACGIVWLARKPREWIWLAAAFIPVAVFAFNYHVADVQVFFLLPFLLFAIFIGAGIDALLTLISKFQIPNSNFDFLPFAFYLLLAVLVLIVPVNLLQTNYPTNDLSDHWDAHDYGLDILNQPLESNATIIGIGGEMTLIRYFQENRGLRSDAQTVIGDKEDARLTAVANALKQNRVVYLTRPLKGAPERYSLSSVGPLVRVQPQPVTTAPQLAHLLDSVGDFGAVNLIGYDLDTSRLAAIPNRWHAENGRVMRVTLYWQVEDKIANDALISVKLVRRDKRVVGQIDHRPVRDAYPTTAWRAGEIIADTYDVPLFLGITPSRYAVNVTMYDATSGAVLGQRDLEPIALEPDVSAPRRELWNIAHTLDADFGVLSLAGFSLDSSERVVVRPGDAIPLTLLWRGGANKLPDNLVARVWLEDATGKSVASREIPLSVGYPPFQWQANIFVRDWLPVRVPANVADGKYQVKLAVARNNALFGSSLLPFRDTVAELGQVEIKNRVRVMNPPPLARPFEVIFDKKIKLLGYDWTLDAQRNARLVLHWRALALMETPYTVFVHLLDAQDKVVASGDAEPGNGEFPTTGWIENEYIADVHTINIPDTLPASPYQIEIGWYDPATNTRLKTPDDQNRVILTTVNLPIR